MTDPQLQHEVEQFLYMEAGLLDSHRYGDWLALFSDNAHYVVPIRETTTSEPNGIPSADELRVAHIDDDADGLRMRVTRLMSGQAHAEEPPSRTRRLIGNVRIDEGDERELLVRSNFMLFQSRREKAEFLFVGERHDRLRRSEASWKIASRTVILDHNVLPRSLSVLF